MLCLPAPRPGRQVLQQLHPKSYVSSVTVLIGDGSATHNFERYRSCQGKSSDSGRFSSPSASE
jgi:hypothetical protein